MIMDNFDDIFNEDELGLETQVNENPITEPLEGKDDDFFTFNEPVTEQPGIIESLLKAKGITDSKIIIVDEDNQEQEVSFYDLPEKEQLEILTSQEEVQDNDLDDSEIDLINYLRENNLSIEDYLQQYKDSIIAELQQDTTTSYDIDNYDDQELFILDLKNRYDDLTDEELQAELEKELQNETMFTRKVSKLRAEYKQLEDQYKASQQAKFESEREEQYNQYANAMVGVASEVSDFHGIYLEDDEKTETLSYLLDLDETGASKFSKDLNDPNKLYEAAWYLRYGKEAFQALESAYEAEISRLKKLVDKPRVVVQNSGNKITDINQLY